MSRTIHSHEINDCNKSLDITVMDEPGSGGANHEYRISYTDGYQHISFQNGPIAENGVNGLTQEALLAIVIDRLECFQAGPFASDYNEIALAHVRSALSVLQQRTKDRIARGVEGRNAA